MAKTRSPLSQIKSKSDPKLKSRLESRSKPRSKPKNLTRATNSTKRKTLRPDAKTALLLAGRKLFAQKGLSGTSIRDVAKLAKTNSSMISYYFGGKSELYQECLKEIGGSRLLFAKEVLTEVESPEEFKTRLKLLIHNLFSLYTEDRDAGLIIVREYDRIHSPAEKVFKETFLKIFELLIDFFKKAQKQNFIAGHKDPFVLASLFFGSLSSQMRLDHIKDKVYNRSLKNSDEQQKIAEHLVDLFID